MSRPRALPRSAAARAVALSLALALVWGCALGRFLQPQPDPSRFFVLTPMSAHEADTAGMRSRGGPSFQLGLGPIRLPSYLDRQQIVGRIGPNEVALSPIDYWAEPLQKNFTAVLGENLALLLGTDRIVSFPWWNTVPLDRQVSVDVLRFETTADREAVLETRWIVKTGKGDRVLATEASTFREPVVPIPSRSSGLTGPSIDEPSSSTAALSKLVAQLAHRIAAAL